MNTKTTNKWLKLLAVAAMLTVNASGAWANEDTGKCKIAMDKFKLDLDVVLDKPVPQEGGEDAIAARQEMRSMWLASEALKIRKNLCPQTPANKEEIAEWQTHYRNTETECKKLAIKLKPPVKCVPNAFR